MHYKAEKDDWCKRWLCKGRGINDDGHDQPISVFVCLFTAVVEMTR